MSANKKVAIINYGVGNLMSVSNAIEFIGGDSYIAETPKDLKKATHAILPGVGAFGDGMACLNSMGWSDAIYEYTKQQKPLLGICLGMQLLADSSTEHGDNKGLGLIAGKVKRLDNTNSDIRIPHIGWNSVRFCNDSKTYESLETEDDYYFVNSYVFHANDERTVSGVCHHGTDFVASVEKDNIWGTQFHPEKSQKAGLQIIKNFLEL